MSDFEGRIEALRAKFRLEAQEAAGQLSQCDEAALEQLAHRFSGIAGMFGYDELGRIAHQLEEALRAGQSDAFALRAELEAALRAV